MTAASQSCFTSTKHATKQNLQVTHASSWRKRSLHGKQKWNKFKVPQFIQKKCSKNTRNLKMRFFVHNPIFGLLTKQSFLEQQITMFFCLFISKRKILRKTHSSDAVKTKSWQWQLRKELFVHVNAVKNELWRFKNKTNNISSQIHLCFCTIKIK